MKIVCHRGQWKNDRDQNSLQSVERSISYDGVELDIRSLNGKLVLSHDPILSRKKYTLLAEAFRLKTNKEFLWALNIKEDGVGDLLKSLLVKYKIKNYMCFDLSFPERVIYEKLKLKVFGRTGDRESESSESDLVFDCFDVRNFTTALRHIPESSRVMFISPELHGHNFLSAWEILKKRNFKESYLCTDFPEKALEYFQAP